MNQDKKRVLIYSDSYLYGGSEKVVLNLLRNQQLSEKYEFKFAYRKHKLYQQEIEKDYDKQEQIKWLLPLCIASNDSILYHLYKKRINKILRKGVAICFILLSKTGIYFLYNVLVQIICLKKIKPEIVHINNGGYPAARSCTAMVFAAKMYNAANIIYQVNNWAEPRKGFMGKLADKYVTKNVSVFITASNYSKKRIVELRGFDAEKVRTIPNTISEDIVQDNRHSILSGLGIDEKSFVLVNVALLTQRKGQRYLIDAVSKIKRDLPTMYNDMYLLLIGNGEDEYRLKEHVKNNNLEHVCFFGYKTNSTDYINAGDVFILSSVGSEDMPLVILNAMRLGKNIIATDLDGIKEEVENGVSGVLVSHQTDKIVEELHNAICFFFENRNVQYGQNAQKRYFELFSPVSYGRAIHNLYQSFK